ncbi:MAG: dihydroorotase, multifunctional complex type [Bacteroidetes bacterium]|nr:MAG: dihydroorotase, multifunctional complex type [Bacteroidota bacterium]
MKVVLQSARILDPQSPHNGKSADLLIENGTIVSIGKNLTGDRVISSGNLCVSPGWFDLQVDFCDPGNEQKETISSGAAAAAAGGFTGVLLMPSTQPVVQSKSEIEYLLRKAQGLLTDIFPAGALSHDLHGKDMAELYDMHLAGAKAFTDGHLPVSDAGLVVRTLLYTKTFGGKIFASCDEHSISLDGKMNEGPTSTALGLKGIPALAEELMVARNMYLCEYAGAPLHFMNISTARSAELIRAAKKQGLPVTAAVNVCNLAWDDSALHDFDTNLKVNPPLRSRTDIDALLAALADGTIDVITSDHRPEDPESKVVEFDLAAFGMIGLETAFALARTAAPKLPIEKLAAIFSANPRRLLGINVPSVKEGETANLTVFDPDMEWTFTEKDICSLSRNTPAVGMKLKGKALAVANNGLWNFS